MIEENGYQLVIVLFLSCSYHRGFGNKEAIISSCMDNHYNKITVLPEKNMQKP